MKLLHINAAPRGEDSRTLKVSKAFLNAFTSKFKGAQIDELNVFTENLPDLNVKRINGKYLLLGGKELPKDVEDAWKDIVKHCERFLAADVILISTPMWNFSIPYKLKQYIDVIAQPKYLFRYTATGPEGLAKGKKMFVATSRGGDYSGGNPYDQLEPYLRTVFGFVGITDITFINAQPMDASGPEVGAKKLAEAIELAKKTVRSI